MPHLDGENTFYLTLVAPGVAFSSLLADRHFSERFKWSDGGNMEACLHMLFFYFYALISRETGNTNTRLARVNCNTFANKQPWWAANWCSDFKHILRHIKAADCFQAEVGEKEVKLCPRFKRSEVFVIVRARCRGGRCGDAAPSSLSSIVFFLIRWIRLML